MLLIIHICVALITVMGSIALLINANRILQTVTILGTIGTVFSGVVLVVAQNASLLHVCLSGTLLAGFACTSVLISRSKVALATTTNR
jgi:hypothetical protein